MVGAFITWIKLRIEKTINRSSGSQFNWVCIYLAGPENVKKLVSVEQGQLS